MNDRPQSGDSHTLRNTAAAMRGAAQGLKEGLQDEHLIEETQRAIRNTGAITRAVVTESRQQWGSPEIRQLREDAQGTAEQVRSSGAQATERLRQQGTQVQNRVQEKTHKVQSQIGHGMHEAAVTTGRLAHEGREKALAVGETTRRGVKAPRHIGHEMKEATSSYVSSLTSGIGMFAGAAALGAAALVVLTAGLVVGLNALLGVPAGHFITVLVYLIAGGVLVMVAKRQRTSQREEAREHVQEAREEVRHVTRPVRSAFNDHDQRGETHGTDDRTRGKAPQGPGRTNGRTTGRTTVRH